MASTSTFRVSKRTNQACENCRRKKIRCPSERPKCSTCSRLRQVCRYAGETVDKEDQNGTPNGLETRVIQLEEKMEMMLEKKIPKAKEQAATPVPSLERHDSTTELVANSNFDYLNVLPPRDITLQVIELYFQYNHRQPLWVFEPEDLSFPENCSQEVLFAVLSLASRYSTLTLTPDELAQTISKYSQAARNLIISKIANGTVDLATLQSLCILSFSNFVDNESQFSRLHTSLASSLSRCAGLGYGRSEAGRRVFWSIYLLEKICGLPNQLLSFREDYRKPKYVTLHEEYGKDITQLPPALPEESAYLSHPDRTGIWTHLPQMTSLWSQVRDYISHCFEGNVSPPWLADSEYTSICSYLMDIETQVPSYHRYDAARFSDQSVEELHTHRHYWGPWLLLQFTYHVIHTILNHPFLYSSRSQSSPKLNVPNTFWKTSSELALLHATWISRLITMASEKNFSISDPFLSYCAAVAATVHLYHSRGARSHHAQTARTNLNICTKFIDELALHWPISRTIGANLEKLVNSAFTSGKPNDQPGGRRTISINAGLMWDILDYTCIRKTSESGHNLFHPSLCTETSTQENNRTIMETPVPQTPAAEVDTSNGGQAPPPSWDSPVGTTVEDDTLPWTQFDSLEGDMFMEVPYDPFFQFQDRNGPYEGWWEHGNF